RLIVCERTTFWAAALRRLLSECEIQVRQTRSLDECRKELAAAPASLVVLELSPGNVLGVLQCLTDWNGEFPLARPVVVAERGLAAFEWLVREAGAVDFISSPRRLGFLAGIARRHAERLPVSLSDPAEQIWSTLPWSAYAAAAKPTKPR